MGLQRTKLLDVKNITGLTAPVGIFTAGNTVTAAGVAGTTYVRWIYVGWSTDAYKRYREFPWLSRRNRWPRDDDATS